MSRFVGLYRGRVVRNDDPERKGRLTLQVPAVLATQESAWAQPLDAVTDLPMPGTPVWVLFENGNASAPVWAGVVDSIGATTAVAWSRLTGVPETATRWPTWGEVTGKPTALARTDVAQTWSAAQTFPAASIPVSTLTASGTPGSGTFLRGDGVWATVPAPTDMVTLGTSQTISGSKTFSAFTMFQGVRMDSASIGGTQGLFFLAPNGTSTTPTTDSRPLLFGSNYWNGTGNVSESVSIVLRRLSATTRDFYLDVPTQVRATSFQEGAVRVFSPNNPVPVTGISATGTPDTTTFLRGDGTWAVVQTGAPANMVTTDTVQTVTGNKTFSATTRVSSTLTADVLDTGPGNTAAPLRLRGGTADHVYAEFYAAAAAQTTRSGYLGFPGGGLTRMQLANELGNRVDISVANTHGNWNRLLYVGSTAWGDGIPAGGTPGWDHATGTRYGTIGVPGNRVMLDMPHIVWATDGGVAEIRYGRVGGTSAGTWWYAGPGTARGGDANVGLFAIGRGDGAGGGPSGNLLWVHGTSGETSARKGVRAATDNPANTNQGVDLFIDSLFA